jgi:hypothetical protein
MNETIKKVCGLTAIAMLLSLYSMAASCPTITGANIISHSSRDLGVTFGMTSPSTYVRASVSLAINGNSYGTVHVVAPDNEAHFIISPPLAMNDRCDIKVTALCINGSASPVFNSTIFIGKNNAYATVIVETGLILGRVSQTPCLTMNTLHQALVHNPDIIADNCNLLLPNATGQYTGCFQGTDAVSFAGFSPEFRLTPCSELLDYPSSGAAYSYINQYLAGCAADAVEIWGYADMWNLTRGVLSVSNPNFANLDFTALNNDFNTVLGNTQANYGSGFTPNACSPTAYGYGTNLPDNPNGPAFYNPYGLTIVECHLSLDRLDCERYIYQVKEDIESGIKSIRGGITSNTKHGSTAYYNHSTRSIHITTQLDHSSINIVDATGRVVLTKTLDTAGDHQLDMSQIADGIYVLIATDAQDVLKQNISIQ